jgi:hypothetical protein
VEANAWIAARFPNFHGRFRREALDVPELPPPAWLERLLELGPAQLLEAASRLLLGAWLRRRAGRGAGVRLTPHTLKLHTRDHASPLLAAFAKALQRAETPDGGGEP